MAKTVSAGRVYLGQEGSGQAQILTPFDATKFPQQEMAITEQRKADEAKKAEKIKRPEIKIDKVPEKWETKTLIGEFSDFESEVSQNELDIANAYAERDSLDPYNPDDRQRIKELDVIIYSKSADSNYKINKKTAEYNRTMQHKDIYENEAAAFNAAFGSDKYTEESGYLLDKFYKSDLNTQTQILEENGGTLIEPKATYTGWRDKNISTLKQYAEKIGFSGMPTVDNSGQFYYTSTVTGEKYDYEKLKNLTINSIFSTAGMATEIKQLPENEASILKFTGKNNIYDVSKKEVDKWFRETTDGQAFIDDHMPPEWTQTKRTSGQMKESFGADRPPVAEAVTVESEGANIIVSDNKALEAVNQFLNKDKKITGDDTYYTGVETANKRDRRSTNPSDIPVGINSEVYDQTSGKKITLQTNTYTDNKTGSYLTQYQSRRDIKYVDKDGVTRTVKAGTNLPKEALSQLVAGRDYYVERKYVSSGKGKEYGTGWTRDIMNVQSSVGYADMTEERAKREFDFEKQNVQNNYNYYMYINGKIVLASDYIIELAKKESGSDSYEHIDLYNGMQKFYNEFDRGNIILYQTAGGSSTGNNFDPTDY